jgi:nicotinate-nucleotide adenylyltransferase
MVGVLGGTFDPVHLGHLHAAQCVRRVFDPRRILLVPCALPPHKDRPDLAPAEHRLAMLRLAVEGAAGLEISTVELDRGGPSYTIDTMRSLRESWGSPVFILGMDALFEIHTWKDHAALLREFDLVAVDRPGRDLERARHDLDREVVPRLVPVSFEPGAGRHLPPPAPGAGGRVYHLSIPLRALSSSAVRAVAARDERLDGLVPPVVARYIRRQRLYRQEDPR